jgi:hypothetical protein
VRQPDKDEPRGQQNQRHDQQGVINFLVINDFIYDSIHQPFPYASRFSGKPL